MACTQGVCKFIHKTDIAIKHKNEMLRSKMSCHWREAKDYKDV